MHLLVGLLGVFPALKFRLQLHVPTCSKSPVATESTSPLTDSKVTAYLPFFHLSLVTYQSCRRMIVFNGPRRDGELNL
ncbi:hypothetical protein B0T11DRAFT_281678 [Plectosphaerella cucumerina]|uniref:Secreted protein n=1 Tax=Plectosphaerella cucumerina TaxID=40658 RepID=A0A8K0X4Y1_9PEZI|nr:hypothetical protein B0T11DRAFT_281678 [Plectosphaerella cucumerina]